MEPWREERHDRIALHPLRRPDRETLYIIRFTTFEDQPTSRLERKYARKRERRKITRSCFHYLKDIYPLDEKVKMRCIQVDSPSHCYLAGRSLVPTHNSELAAAIALYMLAGDGEEGAEIYGCANDRQQASIVFDVAKDMVLQCPALLKRIKIVESQKRLVYLPTRSIYQALSSEVASKYGYNVHACIFDELLGQPNRKLFDVMTKGSGAARKQPLNFVITTAGSDKNSIVMKSIPRRWTSSKGASATRRSTPWSIPRRRRPTGQTPGSGKRSIPRWARPWIWNTTAPPARAPSRTRRKKCNSGNSTSVNGRTPPCAGCRWTSGTPAPSRSIPSPCADAPATAGWICPVPPTSPPLCCSFRRPTREGKARLAHEDSPKGSAGAYPAKRRAL